MESESQENKTKTLVPLSPESFTSIDLQEVNKESLIAKLPKKAKKTPKWVKLCLPFCKRPPNVEIEEEEDESPESPDLTASPEKSKSKEYEDTNTSIFDVGAISLGGLYFDNSYCPAGADIAELLIALGSLGVLSTVLSACKSSLRKDAIEDVKKLRLQDIDTPENQCRIMTKYSFVRWFQRLLAVSKLGILGWLAGIVYTIYPKVNYEEPQLPEVIASFNQYSSLQSTLAIPETNPRVHDPNNYCNVTLFRISFWFISILLSLLGLLSVGMVLFTPCSSIGNFFTPKSLAITQPNETKSTKVKVENGDDNDNNEQIISDNPAKNPSNV